jgi:hypothetical protein
MKKPKGWDWCIMCGVTERVIASGHRKTEHEARDQAWRKLDKLASRGIENLYAAVDVV